MMVAFLDTDDDGFLIRTLLRYVPLMASAVRLSSVVCNVRALFELFGNILDRLIAHKLGQFVLKFYNYYKIFEWVLSDRLWILIIMAFVCLFV